MLNQSIKHCSDINHDEGEKKEEQFTFADFPPKKGERQHVSIISYIFEDLTCYDITPNQTKKHNDSIDEYIPNRYGLD